MREDCCHVLAVSWEGDRCIVVGVIGVKVVHHCIEIMYEKIFERGFRAGSSPRVRGKAKNIGAEGVIEVVRHFEVVASSVIEFGASRRKFTIVDCRPDRGSGERASAEYLFSFEVVVVKANDDADTSGHHSCNGSSSGHPPFQWEGIGVGR